MRKYPTSNIAYFLPGLYFVACLVALGLIVFIGWLLARRREARRTRPHYEERAGRMIQIPPPEPHSLCLRWLCFQPDRGECTRQ